MAQQIKPAQWNALLSSGEPAYTGAELGSVPKKALEDLVNDKMAELAAWMLSAQISSSATGGAGNSVRRMRRSSRGPAA